MAQPLTKRRKRTDTVGRVDVMASKLLERVMGQSTNQLMRALYEELRPEIDYQLTARLGPRSHKRLKQLQSVMRKAAEAKRPRTGVTGHVFAPASGARARGAA